NLLYFLGEGAYGKVFKCFNSTTKEVGAVKVFEDDYEMQVELDNIQHLSNIDPDEANIIKYIEHFIFEKYHCIVYEILDCSLLDLAMNRPGTLSPSEMRPVAQQLLVAFKALKEAQIVHGDLKPDNIMLVNHQEQPFKVKLIDFGCGGFISDLEQGMDMMCDGYRAPEVTLGAPLSKALEMWSLGCCLGEGFLGCQLFSDVSFYDHLRTIIHLLGQPKEAIMLRVFLDFLKNLLHVDPEKRLTVGQALRHPFITMEHLINSDSEYVQSFQQLQYCRHSNNKAANIFQCFASYDVISLTCVHKACQHSHGTADHVTTLKESSLLITTVPPAAAQGAVTI
uniref:Protein kinase domain-containing protein n=1 Tax=Periophthalmus magnuspinnatus TaxID=409849 RepID=A0A3B3ZK24_9GOBI